MITAARNSVVGPVTSEGAYYYAVRELCETRRNGVLRVLTYRAESRGAMEIFH